MLVELHISDFALIDNLSLKLDRGFNVLTGETGAGKSIVIDAVQLLLGGRAHADQVRSGHDQAVVAALFDLSRAPAARQLLADLGFDPAADQITITREIAAGGPNIARLDGRPVTVAQVRALARTLVDLHGQHEHQTLLEAAAQRDVLDAFGGRSTRDLREGVAAAFAEVQRLERELETLSGDRRQRARTVDLYRFQVDEIDAAGLAAGEEESLRDQRRRIAHAERFRDALRLAHQCLVAEDASAQSTIGDAIGALEGVHDLDHSLEEWIGLLYAAQGQVEEAAHQLRDRVETAELDPDGLEAIESRLTEIAALKRKYGDTIAAILEFRGETAAELARLESAGERAEALEKELSDQRRQLAVLCRRLQCQRQKAAAILEDRMAAQLAELGMAGAVFKVHLRQVPAETGIVVDENQGPVAVGSSGADQIEWQISPNPGEPVRPLARIASGGELARIMLAVKSLLTSGERVPSLIFDEIDAGIGGRTAVAVAQKLAGTAEHHQVICVTHLAVIAAAADHHFYVRKDQAAGRTVTRVTRLDDRSREHELARMLGGTDEIELAHAREMIKRAHRAG